MEEIVLRVRRRDGASAVNVECAYLVDGCEQAARRPERLRLPHGVSRLTFDQAVDLAEAVARTATGWSEAPALFHV